MCTLLASIAENALRSILIVNGNFNLFFFFFASWYGYMLVKTKS